MSVVACYRILAIPVSGHEVLAPSTPREGIPDLGALMNPDPFENFERLLEARTRAELTPHPYRKEAPSVWEGRRACKALRRYQCGE